jgi:hypothetical protein
MTLSSRHTSLVFPFMIVLSCASPSELPIGCDGILGSATSYDACGVCDGDNTQCLGCDDIPNSGLIIDQCGLCGGDNLSCAGCDGIPNSGLAADPCGLCDGDGSTCLGCDGIPASGLEWDNCNECGGENEVMDACGVCFGGASDPTECIKDTADTGACSFDTCNECCPLDYDPVCANDNTYPNTCFAGCAGESVFEAGLCPEQQGTLECADVFQLCYDTCYGDGTVLDWICLADCAQAGTPDAYLLIIQGGYCAFAAGCIDPALTLDEAYECTESLCAEVLYDCIGYPDDTKTNSP